jgi:hypothetical protein
MMATPADYTWFGERFPELSAAYCLTLVKGLTPQEVLRRLNARDFTTLGGVAALLKPAYTAWDTHGGADLFVGVTPVDGWALLIEPNAFSVRPTRRSGHCRAARPWCRTTTAPTV